MASDEDDNPFPASVPRDQRIWRYLTFGKFVSLLVTKALWFSRVDRFEDPFEGKVTKETIRRYGPISTMGNIKDMENARQWIYANCWYIADEESAAMWRLYSASSEAIAIQSSYERLHVELPPNCHICEVRYIDYDRDLIDIINLLAPFVHKRKSFAHERELRALIHDWETPSIPTDRPDTFAHDYEMKNETMGQLVPVNIHRLIDRIYIAPQAPTWFRDVVAHTAENHGFTRGQVIASALDEIPY